MREQLKRERQVWARYRRARAQRNLLMVLIGAFVVAVLIMCTVQLLTIDTEAVEPERVFITELPVTYEMPQTEPERVSLGTFKITHYCACEKCCGAWADGYTATGTRATAGRTIAVDPDIIPYGTTVYINGHAYVSEDCGGGINGNRIDVFCNSHTEALNKGVFTAEVEI